MKIFSSILILIVFFLSGCDQRTSAIERLNEKSIKVGIMAISWPKTITPNTDFTVNAKIFNAGEITLPALGKDGDLLKVGITYHWRLMDEKVAVWDGVVTSLKSDLKKGDEQKIDIAIKSPPSTGNYILEIDLVQNSAFWFAGAGSQTARVNIIVK